MAGAEDTTWKDLNELRRKFPDVVGKGEKGLRMMRRSGNKGS
jgi:hypothetical protein